jgi:hypothetical protein
MLSLLSMNHPPPTSSTHQLCVRLGAERLAQLRKTSRASGYTMGQLIKLALDHYLPLIETAYANLPKTTPR